MDYTIEPRFKQLDSKIQATESRLLEEFNKKESAMMTTVHTIKSSISKDLNNHIDEFKSVTNSLQASTKTFCENMQSDWAKVQLNFQKQLEKFDSENSQKYKRFELSVQEHLDAQDQQNNQRDNQIYHTIDSLSKQLRRMHFDIIDNEDNVAVTYINPDGKLEYGAIKKFIPDGVTLTENRGIVTWNYKLDSTDFNINSDNTIKLNPITELSLSTGTKISVDRLNSDLNNATYNISTLMHKVDATLKKLNSVNGYIASNDFKTEKPSQDQLNNFVIKCLSTSDNEITKDLIPNGTKIKNTYNDHIWVLNRIAIDGLSTIKWEDFGSDNICIASNDGVHGLVTGSQNKFRGHIDLNGIISINGLEEELNSIMEAVLELTNTVNDLKIKVNQMEK